MSWVPVVAWIVAAALALAVLGYAAYEIVWKARRLQRDVARLESVRSAVDELRDDLQVTQRRLAAARLD